MVTLDDDTSAPFALDVAPDGRVFFTELVRGEVRVYDPATQRTTTALKIDVYSGGEDGMLGIALDPAFEENGYVYVYHSRQFPGIPNDDPESWKMRAEAWDHHDVLIGGSDAGAHLDRMCGAPYTTEDFRSFAGLDT